VVVVLPWVEENEQEGAVVVVASVHQERVQEEDVLALEPGVHWEKAD